ncbi:DoxX family protein [Chryseobacterium tongliaoense]|uniref:DoxX family protein n=1 Tax=Chryseobacterium tongliaoense TaxID=3240933 RepID=UPI003517BBC0
METENISRIALGAFLISAGISHLTFARKEFQAQVPEWVPLKKDDTVVYSEITEIVLGTAMIAVPKKYQGMMGKFLAGFFTAVLPGNIAQYKNRRDAFGLNTDRLRFARLFLQVPLIVWALKSTAKS